MDKYGLKDVDDDMELNHKDYKKRSEKKIKSIKKTNAKISTAYDSLLKNLDKDVDKIDDEDVLLKSLLKLVIMKKAVTIHIREMEADVMVDLKV